MPGEKQETDKKLSESIFRNRETGVSHLPYERELAFYDAVTAIWASFPTTRSEI